MGPSSATSSSSYGRGEPGECGHAEHPAPGAGTPDDPDQTARVPGRGPRLVPRAVNQSGPCRQSGCDGGPNLGANKWRGSATVSQPGFQTRAATVGCPAAVR